MLSRPFANFIMQISEFPGTCTLDQVHLLQHLYYTTPPWLYIVFFSTPGEIINNLVNKGTCKAKFSTRCYPRYNNTGNNKTKLVQILRGKPLYILLKRLTNSDILSKHFRSLIPITFNSAFLVKYSLKVNAMNH